MEVRLSDYREEWAKMFREEAEFLRSVFEGVDLRFEHFGSTAVPGMKAKPVIDMMGIVDDINEVDLFNDTMASLGYDVAGDWGIAGRRLFRKGGEQRTHHIHFYQSDNAQIERHLIFRDYLLRHPEEAAKYSRFKEDLAQRYASTSEYSPAKKTFVTAMEQLALIWHKQINL
ncbi:GrpB family protein [Paenibacillus glycanilyticus]|uniref:GrpB family protein n=1 Tax=Paenibacillus glycanilyticus TaxID=126569 RepID=A0ABQ6GB09_9BACL|nr:GrpB family protein [Paenibacillus glycanilyticus]GLX67403.1 hypothetical protein MU1_17480 [Paenibacillus glycanilyticus]